MGDGVHGLTHRAQALGVFEQVVDRLIDREGLGDQAGHAVVYQELDVAFPRGPGWG